MAPEVAGVPDHHRAELEERGRRLGPAATVRAMEVLGEALVAMRDALDTRVTFELALVRLCSPKADTSPAAMLERIESLEGRLSGSLSAADPARALGSSGVAPQGSREAVPAPPPLSGRGAAAASGPSPSGRGAAAAAPRPTIGAMRQRNPAPPPAPSTAPTPVATPAPSSPVALTRDELTKVWGDLVLPSLANSTKSIYRQGRWTAVDGDTATFVLPNEMYRERAEDKRGEVEQALAPHFGTKVVVHLDLETGSPGPSGGDRPAAPSYHSPPPQDRYELDDDVTPHEFAQLEAAPDGPSSAEARLLEAFPGSEEISS